MALSVREIATHLDAEVHGDGEQRIERVAPIEAATPECITFVSSPRFRQSLPRTRAGAVLLSAGLLESCPVTALVVADPYLAYARVAQLLHPPVRPAPGVHASAVVASSARLGAGVAIGPLTVVEEEADIGAGVCIDAGCFIGAGARLGRDCVLQANVTLHGCSKLGERVLIQSGAVIGGEGFGYAPDGTGWVKIPQLGGVSIGDDCEIGAATTIDRGALEDTVLERGVILDNQIQVAHNVHIGAYTAIAGCVGIAGSAIIGRHCRIGGGAGILGHLQIADNVQIGAMSLVTASIDTAGDYASGTPLEAGRSWRRNQARFKHLDAMARRLSNLEKQVKRDE